MRKLGAGFSGVSEQECYHIRCPDGVPGIEF